MRHNPTALQREIIMENNKYKSNKNNYKKPSKPKPVEAPLTEDAEDNGIVAGRNAVYEALCGERSIDSIYLQKGGQVKGVEKILALAKKQGIVVKNVDSKKMDEMAPGINHQGVCAMIAPIAFASLEELFEKAESK